MQREGKESEGEADGGGGRDGDLGRYVGKGQQVLKNMKDKDGEQDGFKGEKREGVSSEGDLVKYEGRG